MGQPIDLTGKKFKHLTVVKRVEDYISPKGQHATQWWCRCDCGNELAVKGSDLRTGKVISCGHTRMIGVQKYIEQHMRETPGTNPLQLTDRPPITNKTGFRNISVTYRSGQKYYRVAIQYKGKQHSHIYRTLEKAIESREQLRAEHWPNYQPMSVEEVLKSKEN